MKIITVGTSKNVSDNIEAMKIAGIEVFACVSRDLERAKAFANRNGVEQYADNYDKVLKSNDYDFVYIGVPNALHYEYAKKALENGKNVIVEKPMCLNQKEAKQLLSLALSKRLFIFENMKTYHSLAYNTLKHDIDKIKPIRTVNLNFTKYSSKYDDFKTGNPQTIFSLEYGSGALMDMNCYNVSFAIGLFGLPMISTYICNKQKGIDTSGVAILKYHDFIVNCISGKDTNGHNFIDICGENGHIYSDSSTSRIDSYTIELKDGSVKDVNLKEIYPFVPMLKNFKSIYETNDTYKYDYYMKLSLMEMRVLDELRKSAAIIYKGE